MPPNFLRLTLPALTLFACTHPPRSAPTVPVLPSLPNLRPQLAPAEKSAHTIATYFSRSGDVTAPTLDPWDPSPGVGDVARFTPHFRVAKSGGTHVSVQAAVDAAVAHGGRERIFIHVAEGVYREVICVPAHAPPITLYSASQDAKQTTVVYANYSGKPKPVGSPSNPCDPRLDSPTFTTFGSATFAVNAKDFMAKNLTFANDTDETKATGAIQAVALMNQGDRNIFENVRVLANQDSLFIRTPDASVIARAYFKDAYVEGDVDFVFGRGTLVMDHCTLHVLNNRTPKGVIFAPSTDARNPYGFLILRSTFTAEAGTAPGSIHLGRAWDERQGGLANYLKNVASGVYPNGQLVIRDSVLGPHIHPHAPWRPAATTDRPFCPQPCTYPANRFAEADNQGPGSLSLSSPK